MTGLWHDNPQAKKGVRIKVVEELVLRPNTWCHNARSLLQNSGAEKFSIAESICSRHPCLHQISRCQWTLVNYLNNVYICMENENVTWWPKWIIGDTLKKYTYYGTRQWFCINTEHKYWFMPQDALELLRSLILDKNKKKRFQSWRYWKILESERYIVQ